MFTLCPYKCCCHDVVLSVTGHGNDPVVFATAAPTITPLGNAGGVKLSVATLIKD